jgi:hypothetical protein
MLGDFDETADLRDLASVLRGRIAIDLGGVRRYSSAGVREWIHFVRSLPQGTDLSLVGCSKASVTQLNLIDNFRGPARVESFWAPYACIACGSECEVLLEDRALAGPPPAAVAGSDIDRRAIPLAGPGVPIAAGSQAIPILGSSPGIRVAEHPSAAVRTAAAAEATAAEAVPSEVVDEDTSGVVASAMTASSTTTGPINMGAAIAARAVDARVLPAPPPVHCDACGHSMVLDEIPQHYLLFLADRPVRLAERGRN